MQRILEAEVMDTPQEAAEYDSMDFGAVNMDFARCAIALSTAPAEVLDAGTGTARIPILICQERSQWQITGIDLARSMLKLAWKNVLAAGLGGRITLEIGDAKRLPYEDASFDIVLSNSLVHHLPDPLPFFQEIKRVLKPGGAVLLRDLLRPANVEDIAQIVDSIGDTYNIQQKQLFRDSLHAAFTLEEIEQLLTKAGLDDLKIYQSSDRHWSGIRERSRIDALPH
ncbi:class I SAM-dependent methyltransferase [Oscillatoria sp. FACHB-1406]|uniref:class I SAM-dependent methyltransferase n=1 Tax=Oscillatoria sp. FACHB-1406 TaxID=2692846 RepID=UPI00168A265C|nr:class I SAM-dependent methyltransferase [Oscillatoria sp. FACHB-1406]MBD2580099.1 class I SAM-dependent methyltransferase [Oscillatoria sp. FACHB-1406]